jgi:hypothetical protein
MLRSPLLIALALAASCGSQPQPASIAKDASLHAVQGCPAVEKSVQDAAVSQMRHQLEAQIMWRRLWGGGGVGVLDSGGPATGAGPASSGPSSSSPSAWTTTNTQVAGVDEPDFVKNDATHIFVLSGRKLFSAASWPPQQLGLGPSLSIEGYPTEMFLDEKSRIAVISQVPPADGPMVGAGMCPIGMGVMCGFYGPMTTKLSLVDSALHLTGELYLPGSATHARRVGSQVFLVLSDVPRWPAEVKWWPSGLVDWQDEAAFEKAIRQLEDQNEAVIRAQPLAGWLPPARRKLADGTTIDLPWDCAQFRLGDAPVQLGFVTVATIDLDHPDAAPARSTILSDYAGVVYASTSSLYLAGAHWWWWDEPGQIDWTYLHRFDISSGVSYVASGGFAGHPLNQFSLDEDAGYLRVAVNTMTRSRVSVGTGPLKHDEWHFDMSNAVRVLATADMTVVGELNDLSPGEWVQSSRFIGWRGFVVTFKRIDPLFALDLSDPRHPRKAGVLEVPGFSSYLQPIDDSHLLAIGVDQPASGNWQDRSLQLSVFDVSDLSAPKRTAQARIGSAWAYSDALWDHHAFNWFKEKGLLAVPFYDWDPSVNPGSGTYWNSFVSDLRVFEVTPTSINPKGALTMKDLFVTSGSGNWTWSWSPWIRRSVMASDASGAAYVYAVSDAGIRVAPVTTLSQPLATVTFPQQR